MTYESPAATDEHLLQVQRLFLRHQQLLLGYVLSLEPNVAHAQDIVQEAFVVVSRKAATWRPETNFLAWVCTVARYETLQHQRTRARRTTRLDDDVMELLHTAPPTDDVGFARQVEAVQRCLAGLAWLGP